MSLTDEEKKLLEEIIGRCKCPPLQIEIVPIRIGPDVFKDYTEEWNSLPAWKQEEIWEKIKDDK